MNFENKDFFNMYDELFYHIKLLMLFVYKYKKAKNNTFHTFVSKNRGGGES